MGKAKRQAKKQEREKTQVAKVQAKGGTKRATVAAKSNKKTTKKVTRQTKQTVAGVNRTNKRSTASTKRINKRGLAQAGRVNKRIEKKYGTIEDQQALLEANSAAPAMAEILQSKGIQLEDESDPVEVMSKYVQTNTDMDDPIDDDTYDDAFVNPDDYHDGEEGYEHFDWKATAKRAAGGALGGVMSEFKKYTEELKDKANSGGKLTAEEQKVLDARLKAEGKIKSGILDELKNYLPLLVAALLLYIVIKKFA